MTHLNRALGLVDASAIVIGTIIGTGIFLKSGTMSQLLGSEVWVIAAWGAAGMLSLMGALTYAELGGMLPRAGGEYVYLREAYGNLPAFLYGWMRFWIGSPGSIAAYAVGAATFLSGRVPMSSGARSVIAVGMIALFTAFNSLQVAFGGRIQSLMTAVKLLLIGGITVGIFVASPALNPGAAALTASPWPGASAFGAAMLAALWAFDGWNNLPMVAGEVERPQRNVPLALIIGILTVFALYGLANLAYFHALPFSEVLNASSSRYPDALPVATKAAATFLGSAAVGLLSIAFVFSALGAMNGSILTSARVPYAMAQDGLFFRFLGRLSPRTQVPLNALLIQGVWSAVLALSGSFDQLTDYVVFSSWIFYAACGCAVLVFRRTRPQAERGYRVPGYPWVPLFFVLTAVALLLNTLVTSPRESAIGLAFILAGIPVYRVMEKR